MKLTKAIWESLPAGPVKDAFKPNPANAEEYDNGEEAVEGLKTALAKEKADREAFGKKLAEYDSAKAAEIEAAKKKALAEAREKGDFKAIEDQYKADIAALRKSQEDATKAAETRAKADAIATHAAELAKMFVSPSLALPAIKARLSAELVDGKAIVRVLAKDGAASASSVEDLRKEFLTDAELKGSLVASKGSGGGSTIPTTGGGSTGTDAKFDAMKATPAELAAAVKARIGSDGDED